MGLGVCMMCACTIYVYLYMYDVCLDGQMDICGPWCVYDVRILYVYDIHVNQHL